MVSQSSARAWLFREAAQRNDEAGTLVREVNDFVQKREDSFSVPLGLLEGDIDVTRKDANGDLNLSNRWFSATGKLSVLDRHEEIRIAFENVKILKRLGAIASFPRQVRIFQATSGNINYALDRDLKVGGKTYIRHGVYIFASGGK